MKYPINRTDNMDAAHQFCVIRDCLNAAGYGLKHYSGWMYKIYPRTDEYTAPILFIVYNGMGQGSAAKWWDLESRSDIPQDVIDCVQGAGLLGATRRSASDAPL